MTPECAEKSLKNMEDKNKFYIRPALPQDAPSLARFFQKNVEEHTAFDPYFVLSPQFDAVAFLLNAVKAPNVLLLVAEKPPNIIGYIFLRVISRDHHAHKIKAIFLRLIGPRRKKSAAISMFKPYRVGFISDCFIEPSYRRQGIGKLLLAKGLEWLEEQNVIHVELEAYVRNTAAVKFWQSRGFETKKLKMRREVKRL